MLDLQLLSKKNGIPRNYEEAIVHLSMHTQGIYKERKVNGGPFDVTQACCWMSETPLANGLRMARVPKKDGEVRLVKEPDQTDVALSMAQSHEIDIDPASFSIDLDELILISGDCAEGLTRSLTDPEFKHLIHTEEKNSSKFHVDNFIWPHRKVEFQVSDTEKRVYNASDCFVYTRKTAWVKHGTKSENGEFETLEEDFETHVFVEPNPDIPQELQEKARNTIRLFRLNGLYYHHSDDIQHHEICYNVSEAQTQYDDLKLVGRDKAFDRARTALDQLRNLREMVADEELLEVIIGQQRILMELNGYRSVWAKVFNDGGDPGGFDDIVQISSPTPVTDPPSVEQDTETEADLSRKNIAIVETNEDLAESLRNYVEAATEQRLLVKEKAEDSESASDLFKEADTAAGSDFETASFSADELPEELTNALGEWIEPEEPGTELSENYRNILLNGFLMDTVFVRKR